MLEHIADNLLRFRVHEVAVTADIEKAFLVVEVIEDDRDMPLWCLLDCSRSQNLGTEDGDRSRFVSPVDRLVDIHRVPREVG